MDYSTYSIIRQVLMGLLIFMGGHMLFINLSKQLKHSFYQRSLRIMGAAFLLVPISCFLYTQNNQMDLNPPIATAINLTAYYTTFVLMTVAFLTLLGRVFNKALITVILLGIILYPIPIWTSIVLGNEELFETVRTASYSYFIIAIILLVICVLYRHNQVIKRLDNYYSDDMLICVTWISKSIKMLIGLAVVCILAPMFFAHPRWLRFIFMLYGVLCYLHIYYGYRKMLLNITECFIRKDHTLVTFAAVEYHKDPKIAIHADIIETIEKRLEIWLGNKGYLDKGITINDVARSINTNRTYLSKYVNTIYNCSFRSWISQLRVEEAKIMLRHETEAAINDIASTIGFASVESFTHIFTRMEGVPPTKWREVDSKPNN